MFDKVEWGHSTLDFNKCRNTFRAPFRVYGDVSEETLNNIIVYHLELPDFSSSSTTLMDYALWPVSIQNSEIKDLIDSR